MASSLQPLRRNEQDRFEQFDAIIIGAGVTGLYQLYRLRELGLSVRLYDDGSGVGGTWFWNRYPGCRFDSESETYGYSFSKELLQEWDWKEHFSGQPENEQYLELCRGQIQPAPEYPVQFAGHFGSLRREGESWEVKLESGQRVRAQVCLVAAVGILSASYLPDVPGLDSLQGDSYHTSRWPKETVDFTGKRVAVIGTGATAVQLIPIIAQQVGHLTVFQRTPNYCAPLRNSLVSTRHRRISKRATPISSKSASETTAAFMYDFDPRSVFEVTEEERLEQFEQLVGASPALRNGSAISATS